MNYKIERRIPRIKGRGKIEPTATNNIGIVEYYPTQGKFFFPENLGLVLGDYLDFFYMKNEETGVEKFAFMSDGCPITGRRLSRNKNADEQQKLRDKDKAKLCISLSEFNHWQLGILPPNQVDPISGRSRFYEGKQCTFGEKSIHNEWIKTKTGVIINLKPVRMGDPNHFNFLSQILPD